ncbi:MAG: FkbM family methyltransferase [Solirubrobacteraceae bacterium]
MDLHKLRPAKVRAALYRRAFERILSRTPLQAAPGLRDLGSSYGGWIVPEGLIGAGWTCYTVGAGGDISFDLALIERHDAKVRAFDAVEQYVQEASATAAGEPRFSAHHAAIALADGPMRMQVTHDEQSRSVSSAGLYESECYVELPGRTLRSLMAELGDARIDLLKLDIEGGEYEVIPSLDLRELGVKVFATQLHHTGSIGGARKLLAGLRARGYEPVACRPAVKLTFVRADLL